MEIEIKRGFVENSNCLSFEYSYLNGVRNGLQRTYFNFNIPSSEYYMKNNVVHGIGQNWRMNKERSFIRKWKNGRIHGPKIGFNYYGK